MNFVRLAFEHALQILRAHLLLLVLLAIVHLAANAAFTAFVSFAYRILSNGSRLQPEAVGWMANAPITASLAVIITSVTFGVSDSSKILNTRFFGIWIPVTVIYAWSYYFAWYTQTVMPSGLTTFIANRVWLTEYISVTFFNQTIPWMSAVLISSIAALSVPIFVARRQAFWGHHAFFAQSIVLITTAVFMLAREQYRAFIGGFNPYSWLPFPGFDPQGIAYDHILYALFEMPFLIPATIIASCLTASLLVAVDLDKQSPVNA